MDFKSLASSPLILVVVGVLAWFGGRSSAPTKIVEVEKKIEINREATVVEQKMDLQELKQILSQFVQSIQKDVVKKKVTTIAPDGHKTITEESTDKSKTDTTASTDTTSKTSIQAVNTVTIWKETVRIEEKIKIVETLKLKDWGVGFIAATAFNIPGLQLADVKSYIPYVPNHAVISLYAERRLFWNIYLQTYVNSRAELGIGARLGL